MISIAVVVLAGCLSLFWRRPPPLLVDAVRAFPNLEVERPVIFTHAGDGTNRIFVGSGQGVIHVFANDPQVSEAKVFLDIHERIVCGGEEGLLGLAFHPRYLQNGEFFVMYSAEGSAKASVISRFHVSVDDPNSADATSEDEILRIAQPTGGHNGGALNFGPDGFLYIGVGDGGSVKDVLGHGQNRQTLLGSILRIDVDRRDEGRNYAIPADNPFVDIRDARAEIWAYGLRNVWRMSFDQVTGTLWAADVGEDHWEEINIIQRGGNYGWNLREGNQPFGESGSSARPDLIEPVWQYPHSTGMCVIGGIVYRGTKIPQLRGQYLFADFVANKAWTLQFDEAAGRVISVNPVRGIENMPIVTFGEDETGNLYFTDLFGRIFTLRSAAQ